MKPEEGAPADNNPKDNMVTLDEAFNYARYKVYERQELIGEPQNPWISENNRRGALYLVGAAIIKTEAETGGAQTHGRTRKTTE